MLFDRSTFACQVSTSTSPSEGVPARSMMLCLSHIMKAASEFDDCRGVVTLGDCRAWDGGVV
jgi:hypothetical protein